MESIVEFKSVKDDFEIEFDVLPIVDLDNVTDERQRKIIEVMASIDESLEEVQAKLEKLNKDIDRLTNHADGIDYAVAVISGVISGMIDSFFVGETEIDKDEIRKMLEKKYHTANDRGYQHKDKDGKAISSALYHRLDDLAHHPTLAGLIASILVRYFRLVIFIDGSDGKPHIFFSDTSSPKRKDEEIKQLQMAWVGAAIGGVCLWLASMAEKKYKEINDEEMPVPLRKIVKSIGATPMIIEMLKAADIWIGHMMSDVSTSQGIPGVFLSLLKEISVLPGLRNTNLPVIVDSMYNKGKNNLSELSGIVFTAIKKQIMPIIINEALVRGFYFVRHLVLEYKNCDDWKKMDWEKTIPFGNRTVERMITISSGTFMAVDLADAAIRSATNPTSVSVPTFLKNMVLRVNFVGVGRFAIAVGTDIGMGLSRSKKRNERIKLHEQEIILLDAKVYYKQAGMWIAAEDAGETIKQVYEMMGKTTEVFVSSVDEVKDSLNNIGNITLAIEEKNLGLIYDITDILNWE